MEIIGKKVVKDIIGYSCDICSKEANRMESIVAKHYDWGNDSSDSVRTFHVCSPACYESEIRELCENNRYKDYRSYFDDIPIDFWRHMLKIKKEEK